MTFKKGIKKQCKNTHVCRCRILSTGRYNTKLKRFHFTANICGFFQRLIYGNRRVTNDAVGFILVNEGKRSERVAAVAARRSTAHFYATKFLNSKSVCLARGRGQTLRVLHNTPSDWSAVGVTSLWRCKYCFMKIVYLFPIQFFKQKAGCTSVKWIT